MTEQSANSQDSDRIGWQSPPQAANAVSIGTTEIRTTTKQVCRECGEYIPSQTESCPACGEDLAHAPKQIRCMHCYVSASSELVVCPGCGRELREAPPKVVTLGVPALLALLLVVLVVSQWEWVNPVAWARSNLVRGVVLVEDISASLEPEMVIVMTPIVEPVADGSMDSSAEDSFDNALVVVPADDSIIMSDTQAVAMASAPSDEVSVVTPLPAVDLSANGDGQEDDPTSVLAAGVVQESPIGVGGRSTETAVSSIVEESALPAAELPATATPLPTPTAEPPALALTDEAPAAQERAAIVGTAEPPSTPSPTWTVAAGNTLVTGGIATATSDAANTMAGEMTGGVARASALSVNEATPSTGADAAPTTLLTSTATPTAVTTPLSTPTPTPVVYQVRAGDTLVTIASQYDVEVEALMEANDIDAQDVFALQPGQMLYIPAAAELPVAEPEVSTAGISEAWRLESPALVVPTDDAVVGCATGGKLIWQRVPFVKDSDKYVLHLGFVNGETDGGQEDVVWILAQSSPVTQTEWELDTTLCDFAPAQFGHQWRWWVEVVEEADGRTVPVSPPSVTRGFVWE